MPEITDVGRELAEVPFGDLIRGLAEGIAQGQRALDLASVRTLAELASTTVSVIPEVTEVLTPEPISVALPGQPPVQVTGARMTATPSAPVSMTALQAGISPSFYQFTEADLEVKVSLEVREAQTSTESGGQAPTTILFASHVNFRSQAKYSYAADASSVVTAKIRPVPPPGRVLPATITVNTLGTTPVVNVSHE